MAKNISDIKGLDELTFADVDKLVGVFQKTNDTVLNKSRQKGSGNQNHNNENDNFCILDNYGPLSSVRNSPAFTKVNWFGNIRYDIRRWNKDFTVPYKGIALTDDEMKVVIKSEKKIFFNDDIKATFFGAKVNAYIYNTICELTSYEDSKNVAWTKEVNVISWGENKKKIDIRFWTEQYDKCSKGITLTLEEYRRVIEIAKKKK